MSRQLSFFDMLDQTIGGPASSRPAPADIVVFPGWTKQLARTAAAAVLARPLAKQAWHRRDQVNIFEGRLRQAGLPPAVIRRETKEFATALECELRRRIIWRIIWDETGDAA